MNIGVKHSLCLISMLSKMQPSESMPTKNSFVGLKSFRICAGSMRISGIVAAGGGCAAVAGPVGMEELAARLVDAFVSMGAEVVALSLQQVRGKTFGAVAVVEGEGGAEGG